MYHAPVSYALRRLLNHLPLALRARSDRRLRTAHVRHAQFACYLEESGFRTHHVDRYERSLRRRRVAKHLLIWGAVIGVAWIVIESAHAVMMF